MYLKFIYPLHNNLLGYFLEICGLITCVKRNLPLWIHVPPTLGVALLVSWREDLAPHVTLTCTNTAHGKYISALKISYMPLSGHD